jgi:uncharacterized Rossmann fold enzyme
MDFGKWKKYYSEILEDFGFSREDDEASARILGELLPSERASFEDLRELIEGNLVWVIGNAPSLPSDLMSNPLSGTVIAADKAVSTLKAKGIEPQIIVTDLDGNIEDIESLNERGSIVLIHAHGDNIAAIKKFAPRFQKNVMGTTQSTSFDRIYNFGGFTDGDRAVFLADHFNAREIRLLGFDFVNINEDSDPERKRRKLDWAFILIQALDNPNIIFVPSSSSSKRDS